MIAAKLKFTEYEDPRADSLVRLDLGCGKGANTPEGFEKIDLHKAPGVRVVDLRGRWPWKANSVDEARADFVIHLLTMAERVHFMNELFRVLKPWATAAIMVPHWCAACAYADPATQMPPISEGWFTYLNRGFRQAQNFVDTSGLTCDFDCTGGTTLHPLIGPRNQEYQQHATTFFKEANQAIIVTLTKRAS